MAQHQKTDVWIEPAKVMLRIFKRDNPFGPATWFFQLSRSDFVKEERGPFTSYESCLLTAVPIMGGWTGEFDHKAPQPLDPALATPA